MTSYVTRTAEFGKMTFSAPAATDSYDGYVHLETETGYPSDQRRQICDGGDFRGDTLSARTGDLKRVAQGWLRQRRALARKNLGI